ncbi:MAG: hypothetical protein A2622_08620 [Bdellovibrionales bacterium RIFCSPHIGHO2_01_FULL_40_29]|nr:MAG: hypothetical protein A2622_08620 [Bdellovibrionales bacterium RIFCSPHIGHO2_01_FULL_40_29]OFZ35552.1 MAG: hypothetical protein A3D17_07855 [Bdellovibrionales bacterium RIFCSPHIGHO2_02_FULL_40_15]
MAKLILIGFLIAFAEAGFASTYKINLIKQWSLAADSRVAKKKIGGLSGCVVEGDKIYFVTDDRGGQGGSRIISFPFNHETNELNLTKPDILKIRYSPRVLDLEGIGRHSNGQMLLSSEGDLNQKPRVMPEIFWVNNAGDKVSAIEFPKEFLPEKSGQQTRGVQNNLAFEGLVVDNDKKMWAAILEAPLFQSPGMLKLVQSDLSSKKFDRIFNYPQPADINQDNISGYFGATDLLFLDQSTFMVLERGVEVSMQGFRYRTQLCVATKGDGVQLSRQCPYSMNSDDKITSSYPMGANFEGLCWVNKQKKLFLAVSDNNFSKNEKTVFILYQLH